VSARSGSFAGVPTYSTVVGAWSPGGSSSSGGSSASADGPSAEQQSLARRRSTAAERVRGTKNVRPIPARFANRGPKRRATVLVFWLERPGRVVFTVLDASNGCRALGSFAYRGRAGVNRVRYRGRVDGQPLAPGRYTLVPRVYRGGSVTQLERVTIQILRPAANVPLWRRTALVPGECRGNRLAGVWDSAAFGSRSAGSTSSFARNAPPSQADDDAAAAGAEETSAGVKGEIATNPSDENADDESAPPETDPGEDVGNGLAIPTPFSDGGDGPPPLVAGAVLTGLGLAIMMLIVLLVRYVRGSWNP
jgi:hypothetical protein